MGRRISYRPGPSDEEIARARKAQEDALYRQGLIQVTIMIILSFVVTGFVWYFNPQLEWWQIVCMPPLGVIAMVSGLFKLIRRLRWLGL